MPVSALETEMERTPDQNPQPDRQRQSADESLHHVSPRERFSPDPSKRTDRYRLVTPYELPSID